eukprot:6465162-Amphidinium_carterae.1
MAICPGPVLHHGNSSIALVGTAHMQKSSLPCPTNTEAKELEHGLACHRRDTAVRMALSYRVPVQGAKLEKAAPSENHTCPRQTH